MPFSELFAIGGAASFALNNVVARSALRTFGSPFSAVLTVFSATAALWLAVLISGYSIPSSQNSLLLFALLGVLNPGISAFLVFIALRNLGVAVTVPIIAASPLASTTLSVIFLNEPLTAAITLGTLLIIGGVVLLTSKQGTNNGRHNSSLKPVLLAVAGSALIGAAAVVTKVALNASNTPLSGLAVAFTAAIIFQASVMAIMGKWKELPTQWKTARLFALAGIFAASAFMLMFLALKSGKVSVVFPLLSTQPLFALILSFILLRQQEQITRAIVLGTVAIVAGAALLSVA